MKNNMDDPGRTFIAKMPHESNTLNQTRASTNMIRSEETSPFASYLSNK